MDSGFQRYVIQREYHDQSEKYRCANVAFWTNLILGFSLFAIIALFRESIAKLVGNPGLGDVLMVASITIPVNAVTSIQMAIFKHSLDFKTLFYRRLTSVIIPILVTIPLALYLRTYWALVIGSLTSNIVTAIVLTIFSPWRPSWFFDLGILHDMIGYSVWTLLDAILVWATSYIEIFFIGVLLSDYYLGLYKTAMTTVSQFISLITAIILPVLMPAFARAQNDYAQLRSIIFTIQKYSALPLALLGSLIFIFRVQITDILLGQQWLAISTFIGIWAIVEIFALIFARFCSNIFPAIGKPRLSAWIQFLHLIVLVPAVYISATYSFEALYWTRSLVRFQAIALYLYFAYKYVYLSPMQMAKNVSPYLFAGVMTMLLGQLLLLIWSDDISIIVWIPTCAALYISILCISPNQRQFIYNYAHRIAHLRNNNSKTNDTRLC